MKKNSPRRDAFPQEYLIDFNATKAAIRCGYSKKTARSQGADLLTKPDIQKKFQALQKARSERHEITFDKWMKELAICGFSDIKNYIDTNKDTGAMRAKGFDEMPEGSSRALESIKEDRMIREDAKGNDSIINEKVTFKMHSKICALELIGKSFGWLKDKISAPELEDALNRNSMSIEALRKSLAIYKKAKT